MKRGYLSLEALAVLAAYAAFILALSGPLSDFSGRLAQPAQDAGAQAVLARSCFALDYGAAAGSSTVWTQSGVVNATVQDGGLFDSASRQRRSCSSQLVATARGVEAQGASRVIA